MGSVTPYQTAKGRRYRVRYREAQREPGQQGDVLRQAVRRRGGGGRGCGHSGA